MNLAFWNLFSSDYSKNCLAWIHGKMPAIPPTGDSWQSVWTANPDLLEFRGRRLLYYRGNGRAAGREGLHDRIGVSELVSVRQNEIELSPLGEGEFVIDVGPQGSFDGEDVLDPATVEFQDQVFLYCSAIGAGPDSIGLAISEDGINFAKQGKIMTGRAPDVIVTNDGLAMIYQRADENGNYQIYGAKSADGVRFEDVSSEPVFPRTTHSWDSLSIATVRLFRDGETYYALYGGSSYLADEPDFFGLARTQNFLDWEFHPGNPIFGCGAKGAPDGGAIWFPALTETETEYVLLYEGSRGKYAWDLSSAICSAWIPKQKL